MNNRVFADTQKVIFSFKRFIYENQIQVDMFFALAKEYINSGQYEEAITIMTSLIDLDANNKDYIFHTGIAFFNIGNLPVARDFFEKVREDEPLNIVNLEYLASCYIKLHKFEQAANTIPLIVKLNRKYLNKLEKCAYNLIYQEGSSYEVMLVLGRIFAENNLFLIAKESYEYAIRLSPEAATVYLELGMLLSKNGNTAAAIVCFKIANGLSPEQPSILYNLALVYVKLTHFENAIPLLRQALVWIPEDPDVLYLLAKCYYESDKNSYIYLLKQASDRLIENFQNKQRTGPVFFTAGEASALVEYVLAAPNNMESHLIAMVKEVSLDQLSCHITPTLKPRDAEAIFEDNFCTEYTKAYHKLLRNKAYINL